MLNLTLWLIFSNFTAFALMVLDKAAAESGKRRIAENTLIGWSLIGGSVGAICASHIVRHKTQKQPIATILRTMPVVHVAVAVIWILASPGSLP